MTQSYPQAREPSKRDLKLKSLDIFLLVISILIQLVLGYFLGHAYDQRIFMATGYLVATGQDPYIARDLTSVFHNPVFTGMTSIGYPPPWALVLGIVYLVSYKLLPSFLLFNLAIKLPVIAANICLAFLVAIILRRLNVDNKKIRRAWIFMLFNPLLLVTTAAWGQIDSIVAVLVLLSLLFAADKKLTLSAIFLALAIAFKPTAMPLILVMPVFLWGKQFRVIFLYGTVFLVTLLVSCILPFVILNWDPSPILQHWNAHFTVGGGMSFMVFLQFIDQTYNLPVGTWYLGWLWVPAIGIAAFVIRRMKKDLPGLLLGSAILIMVFFLTRSWLSEPNVILLLPLVVILASTGLVDVFTLHAVWIIPLVFAIFNTSLVQLLFPIQPALMNQALSVPGNFDLFRVISMTLLVLAWLIIGWRFVIRCSKIIHSQSIPSSESLSLP